MTPALRCVRCGEELKQSGALMFSPPNQYGECRKIHLCQACWHDVYNFAQPEGLRRRP